MGLWTPRVAASLVLLFLTALPASPCRAESGPDKDGQIVYCLSDRRRAEFIRAAVALGVGRAVPGDPARLAMDTEPRRIAEWGPEVTRTAEQLREARPEEFDRVCAALIAANSGPSGGGGGSDLWSSVFLAFLGALLGAGTAIFGQQVERRSAQLAAYRETLNNAIHDYATEAADYVEAWTDNPKADYEAVAAKRAELARVMPGLLFSRAEREKARKLSRRLPLKERLPRSDDSAPDLRPLPLAERRRRADLERRLLAEAVAEAEAFLSAPPGRLARLPRGRRARPADPPDRRTDETEGTTTG